MVGQIGIQTAGQAQRINIVVRRNGQAAPLGAVIQEIHIIRDTVADNNVGRDEIEKGGQFCRNRRGALEHFVCNARKLGNIGVKRGRGLYEAGIFGDGLAAANTDGRELDNLVERGREASCFNVEGNIVERQGDKARRTAPGKKDDDILRIATQTDENAGRFCHRCFP